MSSRSREKGDFSSSQGKRRIVSKASFVGNMGAKKEIVVQDVFVVVTVDRKTSHMSQKRTIA